MKHIVLVFSVVLVAGGLVLTSQAAKNKAPNPDLANVHSIFIEGNNEAAIRARKFFTDHESCFTLTSDKNAADGILSIEQESNVQSMVWGNATRVNGGLTTKDGKLVWSDTKLSSGAAAALRLLLNSFSEAACGEKMKKK